MRLWTFLAKTSWQYIALNDRVVLLFFVVFLLTFKLYILRYILCDVTYYNIQNKRSNRRRPPTLWRVFFSLFFFFFEGMLIHSSNSMVSSVESFLCITALLDKVSWNSLSSIGIISDLFKFIESISYKLKGFLQEIPWNSQILTSADFSRTPWF